MCYARKLVLLALMAIAATAMTASTASAQVTVLQEPANGGPNVPCTAVAMNDHRPTQGNCRVRAVSTQNAELYQHTGVVEQSFSSCGNVFEAVFNTNGSGLVYNQVLTPEGGFCGREPCDESANPGAGEIAHRNLAWPVQLMETVPAGLQMDVTFCLRGHTTGAGDEGLMGVPCTIRLNVTITPVTHAFTLATPPGNHATGDGGAPCAQAPQVEIMGSWASASNAAHPNDIEVIH